MVSLVNRYPLMTQQPRHPRLTSLQWVSSFAERGAKEFRKTYSGLTCRVRPCKDGPGYYYIVLHNGLRFASGRGSLDHCKQHCDSLIDSVKHGLFDDQG